MTSDAMALRLLRLLRSVAIAVTIFVPIQAAAFLWGWTRDRDDPWSVASPTIVASIILALVVWRTYNFARVQRRATDPSPEPVPGGPASGTRQR